MINTHFGAKSELFGGDFTVQIEGPRMAAIRFGWLEVTCAIEDR